MRKCLKFLLLFLCCCGVCAAQQVVSSGGHADKSDISFNWILGGNLTVISGIDFNSGLQDEEMDESEILLKVYPSHVIDFINIEIDQVDDGRLILELFDNSGVIIRNQETVIRPLIQVDISDIPCGVYYLKVFLPEENQSFKVEKIIKTQTKPL